MKHKIVGVFNVQIRNNNNAHYKGRLEKAWWNTRSKWHTTQVWLSQVKSVAHSLSKNFPYKHLHMYTRGSILAKVFFINLYQSTWFTFTSQQGNGYTDFLGCSSGWNKYWGLEISIRLPERACRYSPKFPWMSKWVLSTASVHVNTFWFTQLWCMMSALPHNSYLYGSSHLW
jgi:hypothetical protein